VSYVLHILTALFALALPGLGWSLGLELPGAIPGLLAIPFALGWLQHRLLLRGNFRQAITLERVISAAPILLHVVAVAGLGWLESIERWWGIEASLDQWPGIGLLLGILPYIALEICTIDGHARFGEPQPERRRERRSFQVRLLLSALLPFTIYLVASELLGLSESTRVHIEVVSVYNMMFLAAMIAVFVATLPGLLRRTWKTAPLEPRWRREMIEEVARRAGLRHRKILMWKTGHRMSNAAIVGFTPASRIVLFSDALLDRLDPRELVAVLGHEIGHARRGHAPIFVGYALLLLLGTDFLLTRWSVESESTAIAIFAGAFVVWLAIFGVLSRRFELEADLVGADLAGDARPLISALEKVSGSLRRRKSSWRHFSLDRRQQFLREAADDPRVERRLRGRLAIWKGGLLLVLLGTAAAQAKNWIDDFGHERIEVDLRLGRYESAALRAEGRADLDEALARVVSCGTTLAPGERTAEAIEQAAHRALAEGDGESCLDLLDLAILRGGKGLGALYGVLEGLVRGRGEEGGEEADGETGAGSNAEGSENDLLDLPERWRGLVRDLRGSPSTQD
jgi:Zn-dependent protease with chaperone function